DCRSDADGQREYHGRREDGRPPERAPHERQVLEEVHRSLGPESTTLRAECRAVSQRESGAFATRSALVADSSVNVRKNLANFVFNWTGNRRSSSENQTYASPFSEKRPFVLIVGRTTVAVKVPAPTFTVSSRSPVSTTGFLSGLKYRSSRRVS